MKNNIEEDIKILKDKAKALNEHIKNYEESNCTGSDVYRAIKREKEAIENILAYYTKIKEENYIKKVDVVDVDEAIKNARETIAKANKYDALVENVKNEVKELEVPILIYGGRGNGRTYAKAEKEAKKYILKHILKLLEEEEK